jgi:hypothetical protein
LDPSVLHLYGMKTNIPLQFHTNISEMPSLDHKFLTKRI